MQNDQTIFQENLAQPQGMPPSPISQQALSQNVPINQSFSEQEPSGKSSFLKRILKILFAVLVTVGFIAILAFVFLGNSKNNPITGNGKVTLTYWGLFEDQSTMQSIITDFEKQNPNITIEYVKQDPSQYQERLITRINAGSGPDIFRFHNTWYPMLSKILLPMSTDVISKDQFANNYYPVIQKDLIKNGAIYGIPLQIDTLSLFINTQLFQSAGLSRPATWNDFINAARAMTVKDENGKIKTAGAGIGTYDNVTHAPDIISLLFLQNGVDINKLQASSDRIQGAFSFYTSFASDQNNVWDNTLDPSQLAFSKGNLGMFFGYSQDYFAIKQFNPNLSFQVVPVPQLQGQNVTFASYWAEGASSKTSHQKEALLFMKFLAQKDTLQKLYAKEASIRAFGEPPSIISLSDLLKNNSDAYTFVSQAPSALSSPFVDSTFDNGLNHDLDSYLQVAINSMFSNQTAQTVFEPFLQGVTQTFQKYPQ